MSMMDLIGYDLVGNEGGNGDALLALLAASGDNPLGMSAGTGYEQALIGAQAQQAMQLAQFKQKLMMAKAAQDQLIFRQRPPTEAREFTLGIISSAVVAAGGTATIQRQPQVPFRGRRFVVDSAVSQFFDISDIKVGKDSQFVSADSVPASTYSELGQGVNLRLDSAQISQIVSVSVTNVDGAAHFFRASLIGDAVQ